jgi:hypothetical protein
MKYALTNLFAQITRNDVELPNNDLTSASVTSILRLVFGFAGSVAVLIITIAALQYVTSTGDPQSTARAKNTILYALIGLAICVTGFSIVTFVLGRIG